MAWCLGAELRVVSEKYALSLLILFYNTQKAGVENGQTGVVEVTCQSKTI